MESMYQYIYDYNLISTKSIDDLECLTDLSFNIDDVTLNTNDSIKVVDLLPLGEDIYFNNTYVNLDIRNFFDQIRLVFGLSERDFEVIFDKNYNIINAKNLSFDNKLNQDQIVYILSNLLINYDYLTSSKKLTSSKD